MEKLKKFMNRPDLKVVGWYHSHPRITVWPSEVDLRTQLSFQLMDENMVGLIFSVFDTSVESKVLRMSRPQILCLVNRTNSIWKGGGSLYPEKKGYSDVFFLDIEIS